MLLLAFERYTSMQVEWIYPMWFHKGTTRAALSSISPAGGPEDGDCLCHHPMHNFSFTSTETMLVLQRGDDWKFLMSKCRLELPQWPRVLNTRQGVEQAAHGTCQPCNVAAM